MEPKSTFVPMFPSTTKPASHSFSDDSQSTEDNAELSEVDLGLKNQPDFEELISFTHSFNNYQICRCLFDDNDYYYRTFPFLLSNEFLLAGTSLEIGKLSHSENTSSIITKAKDFRSPQNETTDKRQFLDKLVDYSIEIGLENTIDFILPIILDSIPNESNDLKHRFLNVYSHFLDIMVSFGDTAYSIVKNQLVQFTLDFLLSCCTDDGLMRKIADCFLHLGTLIKAEDFLNDYLSKAILIARDEVSEKNEKLRAVTIQLFCDLATIIPGDQSECIIYIVKEIKTATYFDTSKTVKDALSSRFIKVCENAPKDIFIKELLPIYKTQCKDSSIIVRKNCALILPKLTKLCDINIISTTLIEIYKEFSIDKANVVKNITFGVFGEFLSLLDKKDKEHYICLLDLFISTITQFKNKIPLKDEFDMIKKCAFNFPAVVWFFEKEHWDNKMSACYDVLKAFNNEDINISLASSIGELANILGSDITEQYIASQVKYFFEYKRNDNNKNKGLSKYQIKILNALPDVVRNLPLHAKNQFIDYPTQMIPVNIKWREKIEYCKIIGKYHDIYTDETTYKRIFPIAINFCFDNCSQVRFESARNNSRIIMQLLSGEDTYRNKTLQIVEAFARSLHYNYRQLFVLMCSDVFEKEDVYKMYIKDYLYDLAFDKVVNVRITLARFVGKVIKETKVKWVKEDETIKKIVKVLKMDKKKEVNKEVEGVDVNVEGVTVEEGRNVNEMFGNHMEVISSEFGISQNVPTKSKVRGVTGGA